MSTRLDADKGLILKLSRQELKQCLHVKRSGLLDQLEDNQVLTPREVEEITVCRDAGEQVDILLDCFKQKTNQQFDQLCGALRSLGLEHIYDDLLSYDVIDRHVAAIQQKLCRYFMEEYSLVDMFAWHDEGHRIRLDEIYVPIKTATYHKTAEKKIKISLNHYSELLQQGEEGRSNIIIVKAEPLGGKTTFMRKISCDWALALKGQFQHPHVFDQHKIVLPIILRLVKPNTTFSQILQYQIDFLTSEDLQVIEWLLKEEPEKVFFLLDGLDELSVGNSQELLGIMKGSTHPGCSVIITTRAEGLHKLQTGKHRPTVEAHLEGFSKEHILDYVNKYFAESADSNHQELLQQIFRSEELNEMATNPGRLGILCLLWSHNKEISNDRVELFTELVTILLKLAETRLESGSSCLKGELISHHKDVLYKFGKLAYQYEGTELAQLWFCSGKIVVKTMCTVFSMQEAEAVVGKDAMKYGFLYKSHPLSRAQESQVSFIHKTVQEWLAAFYLAHNDYELQKLHYDSVDDLEQDTSLHGFLLSFCKHDKRRSELLCRNFLPHLDTFFECHSHTERPGHWLRSNMKYLHTVLLQRLGKESIMTNMHEPASVYHSCLALALCLLKGKRYVVLNIYGKDGLEAFVSTIRNVHQDLQTKCLEIRQTDIQGGGQSLGKLLLLMPQCIQLDVLGCRLEAADIAAMVELTRGHRLSIQALNIGCNNLQGAGAALGGLLLHMPQCTELEVYECGLEAADVAAMVEVTRGHQLISMQHLHMETNRLQGAGAALAGMVPVAGGSMPHLQVLRLQSCGLTSSGLNALAAAIQGNVHINKLDLSENDFQGAGAAVGQLLLRLASCHTLGLQACKLTALDMRAAAAVICGSHTHTDRLCLSGNDISEEEEAALMQLPELSFVTFHWIKFI